MAVEIFSWPSLHERICRTWGSNLGPLACQADMLPIELPCPAIKQLVPIIYLFAFSSSTLCTCHLLTPNPPVILSGNDSLMLAPYHTFYPKLEDHMSEAGIGADRNMWDQPLCIGPDHRAESPIWEVMPTQDFFTLNIPFEMEGSTHAVPGGLPSKYQRAVLHRHRQIDSWQKTMKEAGLTREQRKEFQTMVESRFHAWLAESGQKRELDSLVVPTMAKK